jgi:PAS domain S-box-containing protein
LAQVLPYSSASPVFGFFFLAVWAAAWVGGARVGLFACVLSFFEALYFLLPPHYSFVLKNSSQLFRLLMQFSTSAIGVLIVAKLRSVVLENTELLAQREAHIAALDQAQQELQESREWLRVTLASIGDAVITTDTQGRVTFLNPVAVSLTGWQPGDAQGQPIQSVFRVLNEQTRVPAPDVVSRVLEQGRVTELANHTALLAKDGREIPIEDSAAPILDSRGNVIGVVLVFHDVTEKRRAQEALRYQLDLVQAITQSAADSIFVTDANGCVAFVNQEGERVFGSAGKELLGKNLHETIHHHYPDGRPFAASECKLAELHRFGEGIRNFDDVFFRNDGSPLSVSCSNAPLEVSGKRVGTVLVVRDITERKQAEEALRRSEKLASVGRLAASIAHEINNPLEAVTNTLFLARTHPEVPASARQYLEMADDELKRIAHITRQTLGFYREASAPATVSVSSVMDSAVDLLRGKVKVKGAVIERQYDGDLRVTAVAGELRQVFANLLANSLDAIAPSGTIWLRLSSLKRVNGGEPCVRVTVADNGQGIDAAALPHLFEPLFTTKESIGSGLGLWVSKQIINKHRGSIRIRSRAAGARRGTVISMVIPVAAAQAPQARSAAAK